MELKSSSVASLFPPFLKREYITQINASGV